MFLAPRRGSICPPHQNPGFSCILLCAPVRPEPPSPHLWSGPDLDPASSLDVGFAFFALEVLRQGFRAQISVPFWLVLTLAPVLVH